MVSHRNKELTAVIPDNRRRYIVKISILGNTSYEIVTLDAIYKFQKLMTYYVQC